MGGRSKPAGPDIMFVLAFPVVCRSFSALYCRSAGSRPQGIPLIGQRLEDIEKMIG